MKKVAMNGPIKDLMISVSNFFITSCCFLILKMNQAKIKFSEKEYSVIIINDSF